MKQKEDSNACIKKSLKYSITDGSFWSVMDSFTSPFLIPYAIYLSSSHLIISLLVSVPGLLASIFQMASIKIEEIVKSRRDVIVIGAFIQGFCLLPIVFIPNMASEAFRPWLLLIFVSLFTIVGTFIGPFWKSLMGDIVPEEQRGSYFGKRSMITSTVAFIALFGAGFILQHFSQTNKLLAFGILFVVGFGARIISAFYLSKMYNAPKAIIKKKSKETFVKFMKTLATDEYGKFVRFLCMFRIAIFISSPFVTVYMLETLKLSYLDFTILTSVEIISMLVFLKIWGPINDEKGSRLVIVTTALAIPFIPLLWSFNSSFYYLVVLQILSGAVYSGFNLAVENFIFDATYKTERIRKVAYLNLLHGTAVFIGSILGGYLLSFVTIPQLFVISFAARLGVALVTLPSLRELRLVKLDLGKSIFSPSLYIRRERRPYYQDNGIFDVKGSMLKERYYANDCQPGMFSQCSHELITQEEKNFYSRKIVDSITARMNKAGQKKGLL